MFKDLFIWKIWIVEALIGIIAIYMMTVLINNDSKIPIDRCIIDRYRILACI